MVKFINDIKKLYPLSDYFFNNAKMNVMIDEWKAHNLLYNLHMFRSQTKDVYLNDNNRLVNGCYWILARIYDILL